MKKVMTVMMSVISIAIAFVVFPIITDATHNLLTDQETATVASVTTLDGSYTATVQDDVYKDEIKYVTVTSSAASDSPVVSTVSGKSITITGLDTSTSTRTLTIKYDTAALEEYTGLSSIISIAPLLVFVVIFLGMFAGSWAVFRNNS